MTIYVILDPRGLVFFLPCDTTRDGDHVSLRFFCGRGTTFSGP